MRLLFTALILMVFAKPAFAELVFYCEPAHAAQITKEGGVQGMDIDRFKFKLTEDSVIFRGGFFGNSALTEPDANISVNLENNTFWVIESYGQGHKLPHALYLFNAPDFSFFQTILNHSVTIHASCEQF